MAKQNKKHSTKSKTRPKQKGTQNKTHAKPKIRAKVMAKRHVQVQHTPQAKVHAPQKSAAAQALKQHELAIKQKKAAEVKKKVNVNIPQPEEVKIALDKLLTNEMAMEHLRKNVSKMAVDVIGMLVTPKTDEFLAEQLGMKINAIRRILNIMQGYGITNYYISKNTKGWLSFAWYINTNKLAPFLEYIDSMEKEKSIINESCNDYFICNNCYKSDRLVFTFDSAFESNFKCGCGKNLNRMNRDEVAVLLNTKETAK
jgi:transcription factor E